MIYAYDVKKGFYMDNQKIENLLNLALDSTNQEREKSLNLNVGYNEIENTWDIIIKYTGDIDWLQSDEIDVVKLMNQYAILTVKESIIDELARIPQIEYIEKPKRLFFAVNNGRAASCINSLQTSQYNLFGEGILVAVIDSGIDYSHPDFRNQDGTTRILYLWDQTIIGNPPTGYKIGTEYTSEQINLALKAGSKQEQLQIVPSTDLSGHGTAVSGIAAGNGRASNGLFRGVASRSRLIVVKLGTPRPDSFPRTTELMQAIDYVIKKALEYLMPISINLSFGNTYGSHDGTSLLETYIDLAANMWKSCICVGTGNEGATAGHTSGVVREGVTENVEISVAEYTTNLNLQIWKSYSDEMDIMIKSPGGRSVGPLQQILGPQRFELERTQLLLYYGEPSPFSTAQEIYLDFIPKDSYIADGIWTISLVPRKIVNGSYDMWLPSERALTSGTNFLLPTPDITLTIPSTSARVISVGAYNTALGSYAVFSGRGYTRRLKLVKPDLVAPGVDITSTAVNGGYGVYSGTSMATPFVTGSCAMLMEWGIVNGNDLFLYGEKVKAYLIKGAKPLPGFKEYPNPQVGWGALCVRDSLPE
ncbi:subtilase family protein [Lachnotalea glycerini]|uniref:Subtilase family protein n=2 Tax=Lachnotalea glycerini TaxID=1763509 RepID=A0A318EUT8_9FIRM|nr:subtilase family protein [Lachnotalea glycerini]